jgi:hypothetical protein
VDSRLEDRSLQGERQAMLRIRRQDAPSRGSQFTGSRTPGIGARVTALDEREDRDRGHENESDQRGGGQAECASTPSLGLVDRALGLIPASPGGNRVREHVVVDLVASSHAVVAARPDDSFRSELPQDAHRILLLDASVTG